MKKPQILLLVSMMFFTFSCDKTDDPLNQNEEESVEQEYNLSGRVQKGPFLNGTSITVSELDKNLKQTGKMYTTQITNHQGYFEIGGVQLSSPYVELMATGFYFNEVKNENSAAQLTLLAVADLTNKSTLNVNIMSTLEKQRVMHLTDQGLSFEMAKTQAMKELLSAFSFDAEQPKNAEVLDISTDGAENGMLLAISTIMQEYKTPAGLSEFIANISNDMVEDGKLDDKKLQSSLINAATKLNYSEITKNLENRYSSLGVDVSIPDFETYINQFVENTTYEKTDVIEYPVSGANGPNILSQENPFYPEGDYSMKAIIPEGYSLKVKIAGPNWFYPAFQENTGWTVSDYNDADQSRIFTASRTGEIDFKILIASDTLRFPTVYIYENNATEPTRIKELHPGTSSGFNVPATGNFGENVLAFIDSTTVDTSKTYSLTANLPDDRDYNVEIKLQFTREDSYSIDADMVSNWEVYESPYELRIELNGRNKTADMPIQFHNSGYLTIEGGVMIYGINW